jgi:hypothetical protein
MVLVPLRPEPTTKTTRRFDALALGAVSDMRGSLTAWLTGLGGAAGHAGGVSEQTASSEGVTAAPPGLSAFAAKVLDQLSLSAWLPGAFFASVLVLLVQMRSLGDVDLGRALDQISADWVSVLILALPTLLIAVLLIQASSFAAIQWLEGYGHASGPGSWARSLLIRWQSHRVEALHRKRMRLQARAFDRSEWRWDEPTPVMAALRARSRGKREQGLLAEHQTRVAALDWREECDPWLLARIEELIAREREFPRTRSTMPTRLGNVLRATEETLEGGRADVASFVMRRRELASSRVRAQHDQFRTRLDMYCTLTLVSIALAAMSVPLLAGRVEAAWVAAAPAALVGFAVVSYRAAVSSARGYCGILRVMDGLPGR